MKEPTAEMWIIALVFKSGATVADIALAYTDYKWPQAVPMWDRIEGAIRKVMLWEDRDKRKDWRVTTYQLTMDDKGKVKARVK